MSTINQYRRESARTEALLAALDRQMRRSERDELEAARHKDVRKERRANLAAAGKRVTR